MRVYVAYDPRPPYLPVAVADSPSELAWLTGASRNTISSMICRFQKGELTRSRYIAVEIEEDKNV